MEHRKEKIKQYNKQNPMVRIERSLYDELVCFCNDNDLVISKTVAKFIRYALDNVEVKEVSIPTEQIFIGGERL